ncbi:MAG TPA: hypothetical protein VF505_15300 [Thermoanaerobaculia bacterium]
MNLYLVLTIALSAISGVVEAPVLRPAPSVAQREHRVQRRAIQVAFVTHRPSPAGFRTQPRTEDRGPRMRGEAAPRAPALV